MKRLTTLSLIAVAAAAMVAIPLDAQTRGGSNSRSGSGGGNSRTGGGSRPTSSVSAPSSQNRSASQSGNTKGLGSVNRSQSRNQAAASQPSRSGSASSSRNGGVSSSSSSSRSGSASTVRSGSNSNNSSSVREQRPRQETKSSANNGSATRSRTAQPSRNDNNRSGSNVRSGSNAQSRQARPDASINRNQPQSGMSTNNAPRTVRRSEQAPRNFEGGRGPNHVKMRPGPGHNMERIPPRRRDPMPFGRAVRFWDGGRHYFGYRVSYLPSRYVRVTYLGIPYYVVDGIYYRHYRGHYYVSRPPFGIYFDPVLDNLVYSVCNFAYYYDVYNTYRTINDNARTIASQNATIAANNATIARQNEAIALNSERAAKSYKEADRLGLVQSYADAGMEYFYQDGVFFTKDKDGKYVTIVPPAGALVQELPDDYDVITIDGEEYYKVDETVYKLSIIDGSPYFEVLGQLTGDLVQKYDLYESL